MVSSTFSPYRISFILRCLVAKPFSERLSSCLVVEREENDSEKEEPKAIETRGMLKVFLENMIRDVVTYCELDKGETATEMDVVYVLKRQRDSVYRFGG
uniref:Histone H4 n=1 Tax=Heterorhabditis bacteriophora TaxID=37862 RepID=A0A1I7WNV8_HETBA